MNFAIYQDAVHFESLRALEIRVVGRGSVVSNQRQILPDQDDIDDRIGDAPP